MATLPVSGGFVTAIHNSARDLRVSNRISITPENIQRLLFSPYFTTSFHRVSKNHGLNLPLNFSSHIDELNFLSVLSLLNFGSGYRIPLHAETGRGAWDNIRALLFSLYISSSTTDEGDFLSAKGMRAISPPKIAELMRLNLFVERPHPQLPGLTVGEWGGPLKKLVEMITAVMNETGEILDNSGYPNLGSFVAEALNHAARSRDEFGDSSVEIFLERLVRVFPAFRDMSSVEDQPIYCFKKALFLIHAISIRFGSLSPQPFPVPKTKDLPIISDNVLPSLLIHLGVINIASDSPLSHVFPDAGSDQVISKLLGPAQPESGVVADSQVAAEPSGLKDSYKEGPQVTAEQSYILRAAAIDACQLIIQTARSLDVASLEDKGLGWLSTSLTLPDLGLWIWAAAKDRPDYRSLVRFVDKETIYF